MVVGFFYGAAVQGKCGVGMYVKLLGNSCFHLVMGASGGTNNWDKLLALWGLLVFVKDRGIRLNQIMGDSNVILDWACNRQSLQSISLHHWTKRV